MSKQKPLETEIDIGGVKCACKCGQTADQLYKGIPVPNINPAHHYQAYLNRQRGKREVRRYELQL